MARLTFSPALTGLRTGQKQYPSQTSLLRQSPKLSSVADIQRPYRALSESFSEVPGQWTDSVLLGIRTAFKEDIHCTAAELVYGTTLRLPGEFFVATQEDNPVDPVSYVARLKATMQQLQLRQPPQ